jgi:hypothetical protein
MKVFVFGAGASKFAGFPLLKDLHGFIEEKLTGRRLDISVNNHFETYKKFKNSLKEDLLQNIELLLTQIDLAIFENRPTFFGNKYEIRYLEKIRSSFSEVLASTLRHHHFDFNRAELYQGVNQSLSRFIVKKLKPGDSIITFNWDCLVEGALWNNNMWTFLDGWGIEKEISQFKTQFYPYDKPKVSNILVYKLHGSFNWSYDDIHEKIYFRYLDSIHQDLGSLHEDSAYSQKIIALIEPSYIKQFYKPLKLIWLKAFEAICNAQEIYIGYSLPPADFYAQLFFSIALAKNKECQEVIFVNPEDFPNNQEKMDRFIRFNGAFHRFEKLTDKTVTLIQKQFKDWIDSS